MKSYSESVAKAADVVNKESDAYDLKESMSFTELKAQHMAASKGVILPDDTEAAKQAELNAKAALVAQAEAANSAAIDSDPTPKKVASPPKPAAPAPAPSALPQSVTPEEKERQKAEQFKADKKSALDQGYTEE